MHSRLRPSQRERRVLRMRSVVQQLEPVAVGVLHRVEHATYGKRMGIVGVIDPVALHEYAAIPLMIEIFVEERLAEFGKLGGSLDCGEDGIGGISSGLRRLQCKCDVYEDAIEIDAGPRPELNRAHRDAPLLR